MRVPETRYAKTADGVHVAYQVVGAGPVDIVFVMGWVTNIEVMWEEPAFARFLDRLSSSSRLICSTNAAWACPTACPTTGSPTSRPAWTTCAP